MVALGYYADGKVFMSLPDSMFTVFVEDLYPLAPILMVLLSVPSWPPYLDFVFYWDPLFFELV